MARVRTGYVVAKEAIVINVGGKPAVYREIEVTDRRTGERVKILDTDNDPIEQEDPGMPYTFKQNQKVAASHPAVLECPGAFIPLEDADPELVHV